MALDSLSACIDQLDEEEGISEPNWRGVAAMPSQRSLSPVSPLPKLQSHAEFEAQQRRARSVLESETPPCISPVGIESVDLRSDPDPPELAKGKDMGVNEEAMKWKMKYEKLEKQYASLKRNRDHLLWYHLRRVNFLSIPAVNVAVSKAESSERIGPYVIGQLLGDGGFARVKVATHFKTREKLAVKIISKEFADYSAAKMINAEISTLKAANHRFIIHFQEVLHTESNIYIVMEYAPGGNLKEEIRRNTPRAHRDEGTSLVGSSLSTERMRKIASQLICAVGYLHSRRIAHCDLKPENVLFSRLGDVKLADFGLSKRCSELLTQGAGSPGFAAPEIVLGTSYDGLLADAFALGVILLEMLCGQPRKNAYAECSYNKERVRPNLAQCESSLEQLKEDMAPILVQQQCRYPMCWEMWGTAGMLGMTTVSTVLRKATAAALILLASVQQSILPLRRKSRIAQPPILTAPYPNALFVTAATNSPLPRKSAPLKRMTSTGSPSGRMSRARSRKASLSIEHEASMLLSRRGLGGIRKSASTSLLTSTNLLAGLAQG